MQEKVLDAKRLGAKPGICLLSSTRYLWQKAAAPEMNRCLSQHDFPRFLNVLPERDHLIPVAISSS